MKNYINTSISKLKKDIDNNKLVIFVGAGVSANSKCPSWNTLIDKFADELGINKVDRKESIDYFLKVPQYYYIERGKKEYFDIIEETINGIDPVPNDINRMIFKLKPHTVITTNFDDLIEKTVKSEGLFYTTVRQDTELPYSINEKMIIKMHGDGNLKNIVLKEEDYLNYSRNFPLIENYIKGLFSTKTVLFVGYSAEDPDFKILFQWVKDQLDGHFQPAYLLEIGNNIDRINFNYYKDRGINILYYDEIENFIENEIEFNNTDIFHEKGIRLLKFLKYIDEYDIDKKSDILTRVYNKLKIFEDMNYINKDDILNKLGKMVIRINYDPKILFFIKNTELYELLIEYKVLNEKEEKAILKEEKERLRAEKSKIIDINKLYMLVNILYKSGIEGIGFIDDGINNILFKEHLGIEHDYDCNDEFELLLDEFDYKNLTNKLKFYLKSNNDMHGLEEEYLKKAYYLYKIGNYIESYEILKGLSRYCLREHNYRYFFIAQFNIKQLSILIQNDLNLKDSKYIQDILKEIESISIKDDYDNLPNKYKENVDFITQLISFNYFYKLSYTLQQNINKLREQKEIFFNGGFSYSDDLYQTHTKIKDLINYIDKNYIIVSHFSEVQNLYSLFIEGMLLNYSIIDKSSFGLPINNIKEIDRFMIQIILKYIKTKNLEDYIKKNNIKELNIATDEVRYLINVLENILVSYESNNRSQINFNETINNVLILLSYSTLDKEDCNRTIIVFDEYIKNNFLNRSNFDKFLEYIIIKFNSNEKNIEVSQILKILQTYILHLSKNDLNQSACQMIYTNRFFRNLVNIIKDLDLNIELNNDLDIEYIIKDIKKEIDESKNLTDNICNKLYNLLFIIYDITNNKIKNKIEDITKDIVLVIENKIDKYIYIKFMYNALMSGIIIYDKENQVKFVESLLDYFEDEENIDAQDEIMRYVLELILNNKIKYEEMKYLLKPIEIKFSMFKFFVDRNNFNYKRFDLDWLKYLKIEEIKEIIINNNARNELKKIVKREIKSKKFENMDKNHSDKLLLIMELSNEDVKKKYKKKQPKRYKYNKSIYINKRCKKLK